MSLGTDLDYFAMQTFFEELLKEKTIVVPGIFFEVLFALRSAAVLVDADPFLRLD